MTDSRELSKGVAAVLTAVTSGVPHAVDILGEPRLAVCCERLRLSRAVFRDFGQLLAPLQTE